jgi:hypothetical protein
MQAETLIEIVQRKQRPKGRYVVLGDMNDAPTSKPLESFKDLVNGLKQVEQRGGTPNYGDTPPSNKRWTASRSPGSRRSTTYSTKYGSARSSRNGKWARSSSDGPSWRATALITIPRGSRSISKPHRTVDVTLPGVARYAAGHAAL